MTTNEIAARLVELCRKGAFEDAQKQLFSKDVVSIEPEASPGFEKVTKGLPAVIDKGHSFEEMVQEVHGITISDPLIAGNAIAFSLNMDVTMRGRDRSAMQELCMYQVKDGKIVSEQFYM